MRGNQGLPLQQWQHAGGLGRRAAAFEHLHRQSHWRRAGKLVGPKRHGDDRKQANHQRNRIGRKPKEQRVVGAVQVWEREAGQALHSG